MSNPAGVKFAGHASGSGVGVQKQTWRRSSWETRRFLRWAVWAVFYKYQVGIEDLRVAYALLESDSDQG